MEVKVKILKNGKEISEAEKRNQTKANQRMHESTKKLKDRTEILPDEEVPEKDIQEVPMLLDASKVDMITEGSNGMFEILYLGKGFEIVKDKDVWEKIKLALEKREAILKPFA